MYNVKKQTITIILSMMLAVSALGQSVEERRTLTATAEDGIPIVYDVMGKGTTALVFVHGWSCDRTYWEQQIGAFSKEHKVITIDLGGHGQSGEGRKDWTISSFGKDVAAVITAQELDNVILIGHSMGGDVIVDAALQLPERINGLVMLDTYKSLGNSQSMEQIEVFVNDLGQNFTDKVQQLVKSLFLPNSDSSLVDDVARDMSSAPPEVALSALRSSFTHGHQITHDLELLNLRVMAINPDNEPTDFESLKRHDIETIIMPGVGHFLMMEDPERFNEVLGKTIKKLSDKGG